MTYEFRKNAYAALDEARRVGLKSDDQIKVPVRAMTFVVKVGDLRQMLRNDRQEKKRRKAARAGA